MNDLIEYLEPRGRKNKDINSIKKFIVFLNVSFIVAVISIIIIGLFKNNDKESALEVSKHHLNEVIKSSTYGFDTQMYKGNVEENYLYFNNLLWRIIRINDDGSIMLILNDALMISPNINNDTFSIDDYLNSTFLNGLDVDNLKFTNICVADFKELESKNCDNYSSRYVSLLDIDTFTSTVDNDETFISMKDEQIWLVNKYDENIYWQTNGAKLSTSEDVNLKKIKPVITLSKDVYYKEGNGTKNRPYTIEENNFLKIGSKVNLNNDLYLVMEVNDKFVKLVLDSDSYEKYKFNDSYVEMLNFLDDLYKNKSYYELLDIDKYNLYEINNKEIKKDVVERKVGLLNIFDAKLKIADTYLLTKIDNHILINGNPVLYGANKKTHNVIPVISVKKDLLKYNDGIYVMEGL